MRVIVMVNMWSVVVAFMMIKVNKVTDMMVDEYQLDARRHKPNYKL